ncbi:MAG TPA: sulfotransferase [Cytophagaceae bacterium]|jgi:hypothetical protein|nr:sulfotransferase [Cytophagaceae bacterium]
MIYPLLVLLSSLLFSTGFIICRTSFFRLALHTTAMLDIILDTEADDHTKQKKLIHYLSRLLLSLLLFFLVILGIIAVTILPFSIYSNFDFATIDQEQLSSYASYAAMILGSVVPFVIFSLKKPTSDYSEWSMLLHRMILNNYNISRQLHRLEKSFFPSKTRTTPSHYVVISGLARSGTSALTTLLHSSGTFHSLNYSNMPFLLSPNSWKKFYHPTIQTLRERSHGDKVLFGYNTIEALEEYFFKVSLHDRYIHAHTLSEHEVDVRTYQNYLVYQQLFQEKPHTTYLAKNNNFILRYRSLRKLNPDFKVVFIFRHPVEHAYSLFKQHQRFSTLQQKDPFALEYMNWLGHHEFGLNLKHFEFSHTRIPHTESPETMEYWLHTWINYYTMILNLEDDPNKILIQYEDFLHEPRKTIQVLSDFIQLPITIDQLEHFKNDNSYTGKLNPELQKQSIDLYMKLIARKRSV